MNTPANADIGRESRLELIKTVERIVRPVRAPMHLKRKMREEMLAHLETIYLDELEQLKDPALAVHKAAERLGDSTALTRELQSSLPASAAFSYRVERFFGWRPPESALQYTLRFTGQLFLFMAVLSAFYAAMLCLRLGWDRADWIVVRAALILTA